MATLDDHIARALAESLRNGELKSAPSFGKPLDLGDGYAATPQEWRMPFKVLKDAGMVPPEIETMRQLTALRAELAASTDEAGARAEGWVARCAERALDAGDARRANHAMAREVGLPLMRGLLALERGDAEAAVDSIYPARTVARTFGGSHAQRDLIDQTLLAAAARGARRSIGRALINERLMAKPLTPLTRHWLERVGIRQEVRA